MERQLFDWTEWDGDLECMIFNNVVLKVQVGKYLPGTPFDSATVMYDKGILQLCNAGPMVDNYAPVNVMGEYKLALVVTETIKE